MARSFNMFTFRAIATVEVVLMMNCFLFLDMDALVRYAWHERQRDRQVAFTYPPPCMTSDCMVMLISALFIFGLSEW